MGTRGAFGFRINGTDKITYNHFDSYPDGLGNNVVKWLETLSTGARCDGGSIADTKTQAARLRVVDNDSKATIEEQQELAEFADSSVGRGDMSSWYVLLRHTQGNPQRILDAGVLIDSADFMADSLFCEFAYIVNFDEDTFEVYRGFQHEPHERGRYAHLPVEARSVGRYYPVALMGTYPLADVDSWKSTWSDCIPKENDDE